MNKKVSLFIKRMSQKQLTLSLAESMTCGLAAHQLSTNKGTAGVLMGAIVCYSVQSKKQLMKVPAALIREHSAESMQVTEELARKLSELIPADICAAITGLASAGGSETDKKPAGTVFFCINHNGRMLKVKKRFKGTPLEIRHKAVDELYTLITRHILLRKKNQS